MIPTDDLFLSSHWNDAYVCIIIASKMNCQLQVSLSTMLTVSNINMFPVNAVICPKTDQWNMHIIKKNKVCTARHFQQFFNILFYFFHLNLLYVIVNLIKYNNNNNYDCAIAHSLPSSAERLVRGACRQGEGTASGVQLTRDIQVWAAILTCSREAENRVRNQLFVARVHALPLKRAAIARRANIGR